MSGLATDLLPRVIACVERAGGMLAAEFCRAPRPRGQTDKAEIDHEIELMLRDQLLALVRCRFVGEEAGVVHHPGTPFC